MHIAFAWLHRFSGARSVPEQRRRFRRMACGIAVRCQTRGGRNPLAQVLDIAVGGVRLEVDGVLRAGETVELEYTGVMRVRPAPVRARVAWVEKRSHGCIAGLSWIDASTLLERSWVKLTLLDLGVCSDRIADSRRSVRAATHLEVKLNDQPAVVLDLSKEGALVQGSDLPLGAPVHLETATLHADGRVVRQGDGTLGIRFDAVRNVDALLATLFA